MSNARKELYTLLKGLEAHIIQKDPQYGNSVQFEEDPYQDLANYVAQAIETTQKLPEGQRLGTYKALQRILSNVFEVEKAAAYHVGGIEAPMMAPKVTASMQAYTDPLSQPDPVSEEINGAPDNSSDESVSYTGFPKGGNINGRAGGPDKGGQPTPPPSAQPAGTNYEAQKGMADDNWADDPNWIEDQDINRTEAKGLHPIEKLRNSVRKGYRDRDARIHEAQKRNPHQTNTLDVIKGHSMIIGQ